VGPSKLFLTFLAPLSKLPRTPQAGQRPGGELQSEAGPQVAWGTALGLLKTVIHVGFLCVVTCFLLCPGSLQSNTPNLDSLPVDDHLGSEPQNRAQEPLRQWGPCKSSIEYL
jgi:hypothetical protein